jgi:ABC-2 type transport system permease protein
MNRTLKRMAKKALIVPRSIYGFLMKDYVLLFRKKKHLYLSILLPLIIGLIYIFTLTGSSSRITIMICDYDNTALTQQAVESFRDFTVTVDTRENCRERLIANVKTGEYLFGIVIDEGFTRTLDSFRQSNVVVYYDNTDPSITSLASWKIDVALIPFKTNLVTSFTDELKDKSGDARDKTKLALDFLDTLGGRTLGVVEKHVRGADAGLARMEAIEPAFVANPIVTVPTGVHKDYKLIEVGIAPLYAVLSLFLLLMLCSTGVIYDRKMRLFARVRSSNSSMVSYMTAKLLFFFTLAVAQFIIILLIFLAFGARYDISFFLLLEALLFITLVNSLIGFLIGLISDSEGVAVLISLIITLPLLFLSGMFYPLDLMPGLIRVLAKIMPLQTEVLMLKQAMLFGGYITNTFFLIPLTLFLICLYLLNKR